MSMRLYQIADQYQFLLNDLYDPETGVVDETALQKLNDLTDSLEDKAINITRLFKEMEASAEAIEKERKAMQSRENALKNQIKSLKEYLRYNMDKCEIKKIECPQFIISLQNNPESVKIVNENVIPKQYEKVSIDYDISKIKEDLRKGVDVPGAILVKGNSIRIR